MMKLTIKAETIQKCGYREYVADGDLDGTPLKAHAREAYDDGKPTFYSFEVAGLSRAVRDYEQMGVQLDMAEAIETMAAGMGAAKKAEEEQVRIAAENKRRSAYAESIHSTLAPLIEAAGYTTDKQDIEQFSKFPAYRFTATKGNYSVTVKTDGNWFVASIGYDRDLNKKTTKAEKIVACVDAMWQLRKDRVQSEIADKAAKNARQKRLLDILGDGAVDNYSCASVELKDNVSAKAVEGWDKKVTLTFTGITAEQAKAVMAIVRGM